MFQLILRTMRKPAVLATLGLASLGSSQSLAYVPLRFLNPSLPPSTWPLASLPLPTRINSAGSADVSGNADVLAVQAAEQTWNSLNTSYFSFAPAESSSSVGVNDSDGINAILWDENGSFFPPGDTTLTATVIRVDLITGVMQDADTVFNGVAAVWSVSTPTPAGSFDIQAAALHELGHMAGLDHDPVVSTSMYPFLTPASQLVRVPASDDRRGLAYLYPETLGLSGSSAPATGEGDLALVTGSITGVVRTRGGAAVHGAQVAGLDDAGNLVAGALTEPDGSYTLTGLPAGSYRVMVASLSGVVAENHLAAGHADNFLTGFPARLLGGNATPQVIALAEGDEVAGVDLEVALAHAAELEPDDSSASAQAVSPGIPAIGTLGTSTDLDYFSFPAAAGEIVLLDVQTGGDGNPLDPVLTLFDPGGMLPLVSVDDTAGEGLDPRIGRRFTSGGTYFARVSSAFPEGGSGYAYTFSMQSCASEAEPNGTIPSAEGIDFGGRRGGLVDPPGDLDLFQFTGRGGDRIHAEVTANRSGSPLDAKLALLASDGSTVLASATDTFGKDPALDYTLPAAAGTPAYFLKVEAQSGAGSSAWYCLSLDRAPLGVEATASRPLGAGVAGATTDPYPRVVASGDSLDLVVAGESLPSDSVLTVPGSGITVNATAGTAFAIDSAGRGTKAFSMSITPGASPGNRTLLLEDGRGGAAILPGGLIIRPSAPPPEAASTPDPMHWRSGELTWGPVPGAADYNLYRGALSALADVDGNGVADSYGGRLACGIPEPVAVDTTVPPPGDGFFYLVAALNSLGEGTLGYASNGAPRSGGAISPTCP